MLKVTWKDDGWREGKGERESGALNTKTNKHKYNNLPIGGEDDNN